MGILPLGQVGEHCIMGGAHEWAKHPQRGVQISQNLDQTTLCSKNGETPGCKGNSLRFVDGKSHPDCGAEKAERKGEKQG